MKIICHEFIINIYEQLNAKSYHISAHHLSAYYDIQALHNSGIILTFHQLHHLAWDSTFSIKNILTHRESESRMRNQLLNCMIMRSFVVLSNAVGFLLCRVTRTEIYMQNIL